MLLRDSRDSRDSFMLDHLNLSVWYQGPQLDAPSLDIAVRLVMAITDNLQQDMAIWPVQCLDCIVLILCISMLLFDYFDSCFGLFDWFAMLGMLFTPSHLCGKGASRKFWSCCSCWKQTEHSDAHFGTGLSCFGWPMAFAIVFLYITINNGI